MKLTAIKQVEDDLTVNVHLAIIDSVFETVKLCKRKGTSPQEQDFVASLTLNFSSDLFEILKRYFPKNKFSVTGVFCHQKPIVDIGAGKNPELGDLLLVYIHTDSANNKICNSILFQAKRTKKPVLTVSHGDAHQLKLYSKWPDFRYDRAGKLNGTKRSILPKSITDGAQYLLIDNDPLNGLMAQPYFFPMGCATPAPTLVLNNDFATEVVAFLKLKSGRAFDYDRKSTKDEWSQMIWDLLEATKTKGLRRNMRSKPFDRQTTRQMDGTCFFLTKQNSIFGELHESVSKNGSDNYNDDLVDEENIGTSLLLIESNDAENNEEESPSKECYE
jgi:hypothetical protein